MAGQQELEIEIDATGRVQVHVKGVPGPACLDYIKIFEEMLGRVVEQRPTSEMYEVVEERAHVGRRIWE